LALCLSVAAPFENSERRFLGTHKQSLKPKAASLEQLGDLRVTTTSKGPEESLANGSGHYVLTQEISGDLEQDSVPEVLRLCRELKWRESIPAAGLSDTWIRMLFKIRTRSDRWQKRHSRFLPASIGNQNVMLEDRDRIEVIRAGGTIWERTL